ncbi:hypothetical protein AAFF_G00293730 [Aldrovandia affinis]|uniref:Homeobox domain-containing protein n=1 Tax=Aldrovandia affinis TaxID=143900 RepID=A0AAD7W1G2_9TELE|nr:hypothetical protein AAFF_G00293730 [Aldrovandia affinis]
MSFSQFGCPYNTTSQVRSARAGCCGRCPRAERRRLLATYGSPYAASHDYASYVPYAASHDYASYVPYAADASALHSTLDPQYDIKDDTGCLHSGITQTAACCPYEHSVGQYQYDRYGTMDFNGSARRKNATRETTSTLKTWLYEHRKNPYPTKGEKIMLAIITKMTLTQVSTWFANARRRLKKENKMTWTPKSKTGDGRKDSEQDCGLKDATDRREEKDLGLRDLEDEEEEEDLGLRDLEDEEEEEDHSKADGDGVSREDPGVPRSEATGILKRDRSSVSPLPNALRAFPCSRGASGRPADLPEPAVPEPTPPTDSVTLSHFDVPEKPPIWSPARLALRLHGDGQVRTGNGGPDCQGPAGKPVRAGAGQGREPGGQGARRLPSVESSCQSGLRSHFTHKPLQLHCSSYPALTNTHQYSPIEGKIREDVCAT